MSKNKKAEPPKQRWLEIGDNAQVKVNECKRVFKMWIPTLGLDRWEIGIEYLMLRPEDMHEKAAADVRGSWEYKHATIRVCVPEMMELDDAAIELTLVHELCHILVLEMRQIEGHDDRMMQHEERVVTELSQAFVRARQWKTGKGKPASFAMVTD